MSLARRRMGNIHEGLDELIGEIVGIAETPSLPRPERLKEGMAFAAKYVSQKPDLVEFIKDDLFAAAISGRHAPESEWLLSEIRVRLFSS